MDFNPSYNRHWVFDKIMNKFPKGPLPPEVGYCHSTYKDNPFLSPAQVREIESANPEVPENVRRGTADQYEWDVYGLGKRGNLQGAVFDNWEITSDWPDRMQCMRWGFGLDFGFSVDPTALIECAIWNRRLYVRERVYETKLHVVKNSSMPTEPSLEGYMDEMAIPKDSFICADCAQPESISNLFTRGWNVCPVKKTSGSVLGGINIMKKYHIMVHQDSISLQNEFEHYQWKKDTYKDKEQKLVPVPVDRDNHGIDAIRYWAMMNLAGDQRGMAPTGGNVRQMKPRVKSRVRDREPRRRRRG